MTNNTVKTISPGLRPLPKDERDFALGAVFKTCKIEEVPDYSFTVSTPLVVKDQGDNDLCTAYTATGLSEDQEYEVLSPEYQFAKIKEITGDPDAWGSDLRSAVKSLVKYGSLPQKLADEYMLKRGLDKKDRNAIADSKNWSRSLDIIASEYKKETYFSIDGRHDFFDNIRMALWTNRAEHRSIAVGAQWRSTWTKSPRGIIETINKDEEGYGHAFKIFGQSVIDGKMYLMAQLSNGIDIGDQGVFYLSREVVNEELAPFGAFMVKDIPRHVAESYIAKGVRKNDSLATRLVRVFINKIKKSL